MAGIKITDLATLTSPQSDDLLYIVDVSDTSQSPQGTSKQIELGDIVQSGTWTPTFSNLYDAISDVSLYKATYQRVGNIVTCMMSLSITLDFSSVDNGGFDFTLPFATSDNNFGGSVSSRNTPKQFNGTVTSNGITISSEDTTLATILNCVAIFQYEVV